jgi:hypothetical protein
MRRVFLPGSVDRGFMKPTPIELRPAFNGSVTFDRE